MKTSLTFLIAVCLSLSGFSQNISDYIFTSTSGVYTEISGGTLLGSETTDDQRFVDPSVPLGASSPLTGVGLPIGFNFNFNGQTFDRFAINANGWISLGSSLLTPSVDINSTSSYTPLSSTATNTPDYLRNRIAVLGRDLAAQTGATLMYLTTGTAPNRVLTIQWKNYRKYSNTGDIFNFQIILYETTNVIELVYGTMTNNTTATTCHVGIGGKNATEFHNRTSTTSWTSSTKGNVNTDAMTLSSTVFPASGLIYRFTPSSCTSPSGLTAANITQSQADLSWTSPGTLFNLQYGASGFALGTGTIVSGLTATNYQLTGLNASSAYQFYVQNDCGAEQSGWTGPYTFYTLCDITSAPYYQNFDGTTTPNMPNCWNKIVVASSGTPTITTVTTSPYSTPNCVSMFNSTAVGSSTHLLLVSPQFSDLAAGTNQVRFMAKFSGTGTPWMKIGTMSDPNNQSTFTEITSYMDVPTTWQEYVIPFNAYSGTDQFIAIKHGLGTTNQYIYIDDFKWEAIPTCPWPTALQSSNVQAFQATFAWTEMGSATSWDIEYGPSGHTPGTGTIVSGVTTNPYTVTGLNGTTVYQFYVRADCGGGDVSSWTGPITVTTACAPITTLPWTEGFESVTIPAFPLCWFKENGDWITTNNANSTYDADARTGTQFLRDAYSATNEFMWTPGFELTAGQSYDFSFWWAGDNIAGWTGDVFYNTSQVSTGATQLGSSFVTGTTTTTKTYKEETYTFTPAISGVYYFAVRVNCPTSTPWYLSFDDFSFMQSPSCTKPASLVTSGVQDVQLNLGWTETGTATTWDIEYGPVGHTPGTGTIISGVTTNPYTVTGLSALTAYQFYVRADCGGGDLSIWTGPVSVTTTCSMVSSFFENFDAVTTPNFPACWYKVGTTGSTYTQTTNPSSTPNCVYIYSSSTSNLATLSMVPVSNAGANTHQLRFKARASGTTGGVIQVGYLTNPTNAASFVLLQSFTITTATYQEYIAYPGTSVGSNTTLAFRHSGSPTYSVLIDDVYWEAKPTCTPPINLTATNVQTTSANLGWTSTGSETTWNIQYGVSGFTLGTGTILTGITDNPYTLSGINPSTVYQYYVQAECGGTQSTWTGPFSFTTLCAAISTFPWTESFESVTIPAFPPCWLKENGTWITTNNASSTYDADARTGTQFLRASWSATGDYIWTPGFDVVAGQSYDFSFWWAGDNYNGWTGDVYVNASQSSVGATQLGSSFVSGTTTTTKVYQEKVYTVVAPSTGVYYFGIRVACTNGSAWYLSMDDFRFELTPTCPRPSGLTAANITQTTADLSWVAGGSETAWDVQYGPAGFTLGTGTLVNDITNPYQITGLNPSTTYQYYVLAQCSPTDSSTWEGPYSFTTLCGPVSATYVQNFDGTTIPNMPNCWNKIVIGASGTPTITTVTTAPYSTPNCVSMFNSTSVGTATHLLLVSPAFTDMNSGANQVRFMAKFSGTGTPWMRIGTMSDPANQNTFTEITSFMDLTTSWQEYVIPFNSYSGTDQFIAIKHGLGTTNQYIYIDNFRWEPIPTCPWPTAFNATSVQDVQVTLAWTEMGSATTWDIEYGTVGHAAGTGTIVPGVTTNPYTVTGLTSQTPYQFYVRAICGPGDTSAWTGPLSITTACSPISTFPWTEGFETVTIPAFPSCWFEENGDWVTTNNANSTYDADAHSGTQFLRNSYSATNEFMWTRGFMLTAGQQYRFKFWWAGDNYAGWAGDVFVNNIQTSAGASQLGGSFVTATVTTDMVYREVERLFTPTTTDIYYFAIRINCTASPWYISIDDFFLAPVPNHDLSVTQITNPASGCNLTANENVSILVTNNGTQTVTDPDFAFSINGGAAVTETYTGTISPMGTIAYTFTASSDFSTIGSTYNVKAWSILATDPLAYNDTATIAVTTTASVTSLDEPFTSFTNGHVTPFPNGWTASPATGYRWEVISGQTPTTLTGPSTDHTTGSGKYLFVESTNGVTNAMAYFTSACLDLTSYTLPRLTFWYHFYGADINKMYVEVLSNGIWVKADSIVGQQQTAMASPWIKRAVTLSQPNIDKIRFVAVRGAGGYGDLAIDDILIEESPTNDLRVVSWVAPVFTGCGTATVAQITVNVQNTGTSAITNPGVAYRVNSGTVVLDTLYSTIQPGSTVAFTYQQAFDFTPAGAYLIKAFINESTDTDPTNDTLVRIINVTPFVNNYPYVDDFEGVGSYWTTGGTNNTWAWGTPAGTNIVGAASGTKAWVTNLTGSYNNSEFSYVEGPCFDFSTIVNPILTMKINVHSEASWDGACVMYSTNGGTTWQKLGLYNDAYNWYNDNSVYGLSTTGNEDGWAGATVSGWNLTGHTLQNLVGQSDVRFRIVFGSDGSVNSYNGFGFDDFTITQTADLAAIAPTSLISGCNVNADTISMFIKNVGGVTVTAGETMNVKYIVNMNPPVTEVFTLGSDLVPGDSVLYTFNQQYTFPTGNHFVTLIVDLTADIVSSNDTAEYNVSIQTLAVNIMGGDTMLINPAYLPYTLSLLNLGYTYTTYSWSNFDGSLTGNASTFNAPTLGWYYITVTNGTCTATDSIYLDDITRLHTGISARSLEIFPNPATHHVNVSIGMNHNDDIILQLISAEGRVLETRLYPNSNKVTDVFDVSQYARGLYMIKVIHGKTTYLERITLE